MIKMPGRGLPNAKAKTNETDPAPKPLIIVMLCGFLAEIFRVKLLSIPQNIQAAITPKALTENPHPPWKSPVSKIPAAVIQKIANQIRLPMASLKNEAAIRVVATPSKFNNNEAVTAGVLRKLDINTIGAATPPAKIAPASQGRSVLVIPASFV